MNVEYLDSNIITLEFPENIRRRPGMYIGKLGDGSSPDDGMYVLLKEVLDNSIDEYLMGHGKKIEITIDERNKISVRDYGRGIPLGKLNDAVTKLHTGAKFESLAFKKSVGMNGVGLKAVNALSEQFHIQSYRDGRTNSLLFSKGLIEEEKQESETEQPNGTLIQFFPDEQLFGEFQILHEYIEKRIRNYTFLNTGLVIVYNGVKYMSRNGLLDLLDDNMNSPGLYPPIHLIGEDIELAICHGSESREEYYSFVNGQFTPQGGTHQQAFREAYVKTIRDFFRKDYDASDIRSSIIAGVSIRLQEPIFESQTKIKLGSKEMAQDGPGKEITVNKFVGDFVKKELDNYLHRHPETADAIRQKIDEAEKERKAMSGIKKITKERAKKANLHNAYLRDCRVHFTDTKNEKFLETTLFITEGDSASGSITQSRNVDTQAVFSLRGKPLNAFTKSKHDVYSNKELYHLLVALDIEDEIENLRYNRVVIATDADVDGMHIRLLLITYFLHYYPDLIRKGHLYILQTPLFRVQNKKETQYCYSEEEKTKALKKLGASAEITRFKGLGEISPPEFAKFIGNNIRLDPVNLSKSDMIQELLTFYMGDNTLERQRFIIDNLRIEDEVSTVN